MLMRREVFFTWTTDRYSVIQMSLIDTWAATGAGAFSLSENGLYTIEAWQVFINRLADDGIFTVSRWYDPTNLGETGRIVSLGLATLLHAGIKDPTRHIAMATVNRISTLLLSRRPFSDYDVATLKRTTSSLGYDLAISPGELPNNPILREIVSVRSVDELRQVVMGKDLNYAPPTDENPYFFNMLRLQHVAQAFHRNSGVAQGNLVASITLIALILTLLLVAYGVIVIPLKRGTRSCGQYQNIGKAHFWAGALYFALIGAGFMFVEMGLIQRLSIFLGHPTYALGILLFTIILSSGIGSYLSGYLPITRTPWGHGFPACAAIVIMLMPAILTKLISEMITSPIISKIIASVIVIFPLGLLLGIFFPAGMRLMSRASASIFTPWFWALNGIFSLLSSALAVFFAIYFGISTNFYIAATCYAFLSFCLRSLGRGDQPS